MQVIIAFILIILFYYNNAGNILRPPSVIFGGGSKRVQQGNDLKLICILSATPEPSVTWKKDRRVIQTAEIGYYSYYTIYNADRSDNGDYVCEGSNSQGVASASFTVTVGTVTTRTIRRTVTHPITTTTTQPPPTTPISWEVPETSLRISEPGYYSDNLQPVVYVGGGRTLTMYCQVTGGNPRPDTRWDKGSEVVQRGGYRFRIYQFARSDEAVYRCVAFNDAGSSGSSVDVRLGAPLAITRAPESSYQRVGGSLTLRVTLSRQTDFVISWYRVVDNSLIKITQGNGIYFQSSNKRMDIVPLRVEHSGEYTVRTESRWETDSSNFSIYMYTVVTTAQPREDIPFVSGNILDLPCSYYGYPKPTVTWYYGSQIIDPSTSNLFSISESNTLRIGPLGESHDLARIECRVRDNIRQLQIVYRLDLGIPPRIQTTNCDVDLCRGMNVQLNCQSIGESTLTYSWYKSTDPNTRITPSSKYKLYSNGRLDIVNSNSSDVGNYQCRVNNKYGSDSISCGVRARTTVRMISREQRILKTIGRNTNVYCRVYGALEARITWYKDVNEGLPQDAVISTQKSGLTVQSILSFSSLNRQHAGEYTCVVSSCADELRQTHQLSVRQNIEITRTAETFKFCSGKTVAFPCEATGFPEPAISWYFNGEEIISGQSGFSIDEENNLIVTEGPSDKTGYYKCNASNPFSWRSVRFRVLFRDTPLPSFQQREQRLPALTEDFCLSCLPTISGVKYTYNWYQQGSEIADSPKYNISRGWLLCITNFQPRDLGTYKCEATNCEGTAEKTFSINSYRDQEIAPVISTTRTEYAAIEGGTVRMLCRASGYPAPSITWYHGENRISGNSADLRINNVIRSLHNGTYKCVADNIAGRDALFMNLIVYQAPMLRSTRSRYVDLGVTVCFDCLVLKGYPMPTVEWTKDEVGIVSQGRVSINQVNNTLCISEVTSSDRGAYRCTVRNNVGSAYVQGRLSVRTCGRIRFKATSLNHTASVGETISLQCPIEINRFQCSTFLLWRYVTRGSRGRIEIVQEQDPRLIGHNLVMRVNMSHTGQYQCIAYNDLSTIAQIHKLSIVSPPWEIPFIRRQVFRANSEVSIHCPIRGVPQPRYTWSLEGSELQPGDNLVINRDRITINNAMVSNTGLYSCSGRNRYGQREVRFEVTICGEINVEFTGDSEVEERTWATFTCSLREETVPDSVEFFIGLQRLNVTGQTNRFIYSKSDQNTVELSVWARQEDSGPISCRINTTCGSSERTLTLRVTPIDSSKLRVVQSQITRPGTQLPNCHNQFTLQCPVTAKPRPVYKWYFNDSIIRFNRSPNKVSSRGRKEITVHDPDMSDAGRYRCEATNTQGRIRYTYLISVQIPRTLRNVQRHVVFEGETLTLGCNSTLLANRKWSKDLSRYSRIDSYLSNDLIFDSADSGDDGVYLCCAKSGGNIYKYVHEVQVQT